MENSDAEVEAALSAQIIAPGLFRFRQFGLDTYFICMEMYASSQLALIVGESLVNDISMKRLLTELRDGSIRETMSKGARKQLFYTI